MTGSTSWGWVDGLARALIRFRRSLILIFVLVTMALAWSATMLRADAGFTKMIPLDHPFMKVFMKYQSVFGGANRVLVSISPTDGDIYDAQTLQLLRQVTEEVFYIKGSSVVP